MNIINIPLCHVTYHHTLLHRRVWYTPTMAEKVEKKGDVTQCTVTGERLETAELHQTVDLTLTAKLSNGKETSPGVVNVAGELKSLHDESVVQCGVHQLGAGKYRIQ